MRARRGATIADTIKELSAEQRVALRAVEQARSTETDRVRREAMQSKIKVRDALVAGVPVKVLMSSLNLGRARIYQMRDEADSYET